MVESKIAKFFNVILPFSLCCFSAFFLGKDINFDAVNYHGYAAFGLIEGRLWQDFFPAGPQSYLNPIGYVPFYFLKLWLNDLGVALGLAFLQSIAVFGLIYLARELLCAKKNPFLFYSSIILGLMTSVFWQVIGTSFIDLYVCGLDLFALVFLIRWSKSTGVEYFNPSVSALLFGAAAGLKLTAIIFAVSAGVVCLLYFVIVLRRFRQFALFVVMGLIGFLAIEGWWACLVYQRTGNPFFPYFNNVFHSPYYPAVSISNTRFIPEGFWNGLIFPFKAVLPAPWLYQELRAPDIRLCALLPLIFSVFYLAKNKGKEIISGLIATSFFSVAYVLWLISSGNGRYAIILFTCVGVLIGWALLCVFRAPRANLIMLVIVLLQLACVVVGGNFRWTSQPFSNTDNWYGYTIPEKLVSMPHLYLTSDMNSYSFLAEAVAAKSSFINVSGQLSLPFSDKLRADIYGSMKLAHGRVRFVSLATLAEKSSIDDGLPRINSYQLNSRMIYIMNARFSRFGFKVDETDCVFINSKAASAPLLFSCALTPDDSLKIYDQDVVQFDKVFNEIEEKCPMFFNPKVSVTEKHGDLWIRNYVGSEAKMYVSGGGVWLGFSDRIGVIRLGVFEDLVKSTSNLSCANSLVRVSDDLM